MILATIFIGPAGRGEDLALPPQIQRNIWSLKHLHPTLAHKMFSDEDIVALLDQRFPREVLDAYNTLRPYAYKADLARYCILYELGGIYADLSHFFVRAMPFDGTLPIVFRDLMFSAPWDTNTSLFAVPPRHKALERAIELVCANVQRRHYGSTFLCPTGPALFGKAWASTCEPEELITGASIAFKTETLRTSFPGLTLPPGPRAHTLMLDHKIIAIKRKRRGVAGLGELGVTKNDDYMAQWNAREIYQ